MSEAPLTDEELRMVRSLLRGLSVPEWKALKAIASGIVGAMGGAAAATQNTPTAGRIASDYEMGGQYGDPSVRKDPKRWAGASYVGAHYSHCPTDYLLTLADFLEWRAGQDQKKPDAKKHPRTGKFYWEYDLKDASLARGWAGRNRGKDMPPPTPVAESSAADEPAETYASDGEENWVPT